jgi:hypothetical protein
MINECGAGGGMKTGRGNRTTRIKHAPSHSVHQQIPHDLVWDRTQTGKPATNRLSCGTVLHGDTYLAVLFIVTAVRTLQSSTVHLHCPCASVPKATRSLEMLSWLYRVLCVPGVRQISSSRSGAKGLDGGVGKISRTSESR